MKSQFHALLVLLCCLFPLALSSQTSYVEYAPNQLIVQFSPQKAHPAASPFDRPVLRALNRRYGLQSTRLTGNRQNRNTYLLQFSGKPEVPELAQAYAATGYFEYVEPNYRGYGGGQAMSPPIQPSDAYYSRQWSFDNTGAFNLSPSTQDADIDMDLALDIERGSPGVTVAILDSGVKLDHPEFNGRIWSNVSDPFNGQDDDQNGYVDDTRGWDFAYEDNDPADDFGHGTNVAGIIGANGNNNIGYAGIDWNCRLMILKILDDSNFGLYSWWADAIYYAVDHGAQIINMSVGGTSNSNLLREAVAYAHQNGVTIVACMMNTNSDQPYYPAAFEQTIAVGATDPDDRRTAPFFWDAGSGSNYGSHLDLIAPGNYIYGLHYRSNTNYNTYWGGTSQAAPHVAGVAALLLAQSPGRTPEELREILTGTAEDGVGSEEEDSPGWDPYYGHGRLNAFRALQQTISTEGFHPASFFIYPNPLGSQPLTLQYRENKQRSVTLELFNALGRRVFNRQMDIHPGDLNIDLPALPTGVYQLLISDDEAQYGEKLVITKERP